MSDPSLVILDDGKKNAWQSLNKIEKKSSQNWQSHTAWKEN